MHTWVGHGRWIYMDLTAGGFDWGPALGGEGVVTPSSLPSAGDYFATVQVRGAAGRAAGWRCWCWCLGGAVAQGAAAWGPAVQQGQPRRIVYAPHCCWCTCCPSMHALHSLSPCLRSSQLPYIQPPEQVALLPMGC